MTNPLEFHLPRVTGDPAGHGKGDMWYNDTTNKIMGNVNGVATDLAATGGGGGGGVGLNGYAINTGAWYHLQNGPTTTIAITAARLHAVPFTMFQSKTMTGLAHSIATAFTTAGSIRMGVYDDLNGLPGSLVVEFSGGWTATAGVNYWSGASVSLSAGSYWAVCVLQGGSGGTAQWHTVSGNVQGVPNKSAAPTFNASENTVHKNSVTGALPSSFGTPTGTSPGPRMAILF